MSVSVPDVASLERSLQQDIVEAIAEYPLLVYIKGTPGHSPSCGFSNRVLQLFQNKNLTFKAIDVMTVPGLRDALKSYSNWPTFPQVYANGTLIGGYDIIMQMQEEGTLDTLLQKTQSSAENPTS